PLSGRCTHGPGIQRTSYAQRRYLVDLRLAQSPGPGLLLVAADYRYSRRQEPDRAQRRQCPAYPGWLVASSCTTTCTIGLACRRERTVLVTSSLIAVLSALTSFSPWPKPATVSPISSTSSFRVSTHSDD